MSGFVSLAGQAILLLAIIGILGFIVGWSLGSIRASRGTAERYDAQLRATLRRMSDTEAEAVTLRGRLDESLSSRAAQQREVESQENLVTALEARLAEAESAAEEAKRHARALETLVAETDVNKTEAETETEDRATDPDPHAQPVTSNGANAVERAGAIARRTAGGDDLPEDDLTNIRGVGTVIERMLKELGFVSYRQIARLTDAEIDVIDEALNAFHGRIRRDDWMASAANLHRTSYGADA